MASVTQTINAVGTSVQLLAKKGDSIKYSIDASNDFDGIVKLRRTNDGGQTREILLSTNADVAETTIENAEGLYDFQVTLGSANTITGDVAVMLGDAPVVKESIVDPNGAQIFERTDQSYTKIVRVDQKLVIPAVHHSRIGATSGWVTNAASDAALVTLPASQTNATLVVAVGPMKVGCTITGFHLIGQVESAGNNVTINAALRKMTAAAADVADASVGAITELVVNSDTIISSANAGKTGLSEVAGEDEIFYVLIRGTTTGSTDIALQGVAIIYDEV
jgi:hypothetical protein